ncbi:hypothetical protein [Streptomyces roseifaciens]|uniref:hypothetical protein n=1 Tax=Streptomyces roseifaciens TaxID=1488406 RepID=UPI000717F63C|nr:hypothetical protein [Streptomyces roseifaciens]
MAFLLGTAWLAGALVVPWAWKVGVVWAWAGGLPGAVGALVAGSAVMVAALFAAGLPVRDMRAGPAAPPVRRTTSGQVGWAVAVFLGGSAGVALGYLARQSGDIGLGGDSTLFLWCGVPYALCAALSVPARAVRATAGTVMATTAVLLVWSGYEADRSKELASLLEGSPLPREHLLLPEAPDGYEIDAGNGSISAGGLRLGYRHTGSGKNPQRQPFQYEVSPGSTSPCADHTLPGPATCKDLGGGFTSVTRKLGDGSTADGLSLQRDGVTLTVTVYEPVPGPELRRMLERAHRADDGELLRALHFEP